jgi:hypothetical protein
MQRGYIVRIQELQVENKSLHARNRYLTEAKDGELRKKELELERERQRDSVLIAGLEQQVKRLHEQLEGAGARSAPASSVEAMSHLTSIAPPALPEALEAARGAELRRQSSALSQKLARHALSDSAGIARETPMTLDELINGGGGDVAALTLLDGVGGAAASDPAPGGGRHAFDAAQEAAPGLTLDQLLGGFELGNDDYY